MKDLKLITVKPNVELVEKAIKDLRMREEYFSIGKDIVKAKFEIDEWNEFTLHSVYFDGVDISNVLLALDKWGEIEEDFSYQLRESVKRWKKEQ
jgi:hypothetical protein